MINLIALLFCSGVMVCAPKGKRLTSKHPQTKTTQRNPTLTEEQKLLYEKDYKGGCKANPQRLFPQDPRLVASINGKSIISLPGPNAWKINVIVEIDEDSQKRRLRVACNFFLRDIFSIANINCSEKKELNSKNFETM